MRRLLLRISSFFLNVLRVYWSSVEVNRKTKTKHGELEQGLYLKVRLCLVLEAWNKYQDFIVNIER